MAGKLLVYQLFASPKSLQDNSPSINSNRRNCTNNCYYLTSSCNLFIISWSFSDTSFLTSLWLCFSVIWDAAGLGASVLFFVSVHPVNMSDHMPKTASTMPAIFFIELILSFFGVRVAVMPLWRSKVNNKNWTLATLWGTCVCLLNWWGQCINFKPENMKPRLSSPLRREEIEWSNLNMK